MQSSPSPSLHKENSKKLPTPPPDPRGTKVETEDRDKDNKELLEYLMTSLRERDQRTFSRSDSIYGPAIAVEEAFNHLEKLYKLMDQFLNLRQQNARLQRRVQDLEQSRNLEKMNRKVELNLERENVPTNVEEETALADNIFETVLAMGRKEDKLKMWNQSRFRQSLLRKQRDRRVSLAFDDDNVRSSRSRRASGSSQWSKISNWTRVKAAFKWERASTSVSDGHKSHDFPRASISSQPSSSYKSTQYLRVPSTSEDLGTSPGESEVPEGSSPSISTASSTELITESNKYNKQQLRSSKRSNEDQQIFAKFESYNNPLESKGIQSSRTRKSGRRKQTLSSRSDDYKLDISIDESGNEDVFENEDKGDDCIPSRVKEKYRELLNEDRYREQEEKIDDHISKWNRIKRAFLNHPNSPSGDGEESNAFSYKLVDSQPGPSTDLNTLKIQAEIQKNYEQLQKRLSQEFQAKLQEWEKIKLHSTGSASGNQMSEEQKDEAFMKKMEEWQRIKSHSSKLQAMEMMKQENLPPEFKKRLQEWQRMKKCPNKEELITSPSSSPKRKLSEWSKWKPSQHSDENLKQAKSYQDCNDFNSFGGAIHLPKKLKETNQKELQWLEKELSKIEKEKQRLEREKQKFIEREEKLTKLRKSVMGNNDKREIFIHTPSGFHRFEGISQKFTQKLYEWEKSQGIGPESSTIALLSSGFSPKSNLSSDQPGNPFKSGNVTLTRSKSDDSLMVNNPSELISHQPSSLSLNHMEELEKEYMTPVQDSSETLDIFQTDSNLDEPEAVIVEVEDIVEETASPLKDTSFEEKLTPVYQRQPEDKIWLHQSNKTNYFYGNVGQDISNLLSKISNTNGSTEVTVDDEISNQLKITEDILNKLQSLKSSIDSDPEPQFFPEKLKNINLSVKDLFKTLTLKVEDLKTELEKKMQKGQKNPVEIDKIMEDLRTQICVLNDFEKSEKSENFELKEPSPKISEEKARLEQVKQGAIKKRFRSKQQRSASKEVTDDSEEENDQKTATINRPRTTNITRSKPLQSDSKIRSKKIKIKMDQLTFETPKIETKPHFSKITTPARRSASSSNNAVLVETTKTIFNPQNEKDEEKIESQFQRNSSRNKRPTHLPTSPTLNRKSTKEISPCIRLMMNRYNQKVSEQDNNNAVQKTTPKSGSVSPVAWRSPLSERRVVKVQKEKYLTELNKLATPSEVQKSASVSHLRPDKVVTVTSSTGNEISRSVSAGAIGKSEYKQVEIKNKNLEKRNRPDNLKINAIHPEKEDSSGITKIQNRLKTNRFKFITAPINLSFSVPSSSKDENKSVGYFCKNRLSQLSVESESSCDSSAWEGVLMKSASAGMINIDANSFKQFDAAIHKDGYVSLPRSPSKPKGFLLLNAKLGLSNIASKFRRVKMRRHNKEGNNGKSMNTISALCRQSLVVNINSEPSSDTNTEQSSRRNSILTSSPDKKDSTERRYSSSDTSPTTVKSTSWIKRSKLFSKHKE